MLLQCLLAYCVIYYAFAVFLLTFVYVMRNNEPISAATSVLLIIFLTKLFGEKPKTEILLLAFQSLFFSVTCGRENLRFMLAVNDIFF